MSALIRIGLNRSLNFCPRRHFCYFPKTLKKNYLPKKSSSKQFRFIQQSPLISVQASENVDDHAIVTDLENVHGTADKKKKTRRMKKFFGTGSKSLYSGKAHPESMALANNHLAVNLHRLLAEEKKNVFFSPFSISSAMAMLLCGSEGQTEAEMRNVLGYDHADIATQDIASVLKQYMSLLLEHKGSYTLNSANSVLIQEGFQVKDDFKLVLQESFQALFMEVDFQRDTQSVIKHINDWVKEKTNKMIPQFLDSLQESIVMVLLNAVYFKGSWLQKFDKKSTSGHVFYNFGDVGHSKMVDMMHIKDDFNFVERNSFKALQLPYEGDNIAMLILLPHSRDGLEALEAKLTVNFLRDLSRSMHIREVDVSLPRFKLEYSKPLVSAFQQLGVGSLFSSGAELGGISDLKEFYLSEIIHKAVLVVNEEGSEAAAATGIMMDSCPLNCDPDPNFTVDHPFAFVIFETNSNLILFMGRVEEL